MAYIRVTYQKTNAHALSDVMKVMVCLVHENNTVNKDKFKNKLTPMNPDLIVFLKGLLGYKD